MKNFIDNRQGTIKGIKFFHSAKNILPFSFTPKAHEIFLARIFNILTLQEEKKITAKYTQ